MINRFFKFMNSPAKVTVFQVNYHQVLCFFAGLVVGYLKWGRG